MSRSLENLDHRHLGHLGDESGLWGQAQHIAFPRDPAEAAMVVSLAAARGLAVTVQGGRTGLAGGAVPRGGLVLNLSRLDGVRGLERDGRGRFVLEVGAGLSLAGLGAWLDAAGPVGADWSPAARAQLGDLAAAGPLHWPPDPTESGATVGGVAANRARGATSRLHGPTGGHLAALTVVEPRGGVWRVPQGAYRAEAGVCPLPDHSIWRLEGPAASWSGDLMDLFLGSEGMLGVITGLELILAPRPAACWGLVFFFPGVAGAASLAVACDRTPTLAPGSVLASRWLLDGPSLAAAARWHRSTDALAGLPPLPAEAGAALYLELHGADEAQLEATAGQLLALAEAHGGDAEGAWAFTDPVALDRGRRLRHVAAEAVNARLAQWRRERPGAWTLDADLAWPAGADPAALLTRLELDRASRGLAGAIAGRLDHPGPRLTLWPEDTAQAVAGQEFLAAWAAELAGAGGGLVPAHGVGKTHGHLLGLAPPAPRQAALFSLKRLLDPRGLWNPGNMDHR